MDILTTLYLLVVVIVGSASAQGGDSASAQNGAGGDSASAQNGAGSKDNQLSWLPPPYAHGLGSFPSGGPLPAFVNRYHQGVYQPLGVGAGLGSFDGYRGLSLVRAY